VTRAILLALSLLAAIERPISVPLSLQDREARLSAGRFTVTAYPADLQLARSMLASAAANDSFPGLPRPTDEVHIAIAPDRRRFREWIGPAAPEWGAAVAFPSQRRIVMQGRGAGSDAGDPIQVLRHELAHLALHEALGELPPRWFDEGYASYAAGEWTRDEVLATNLALAVRRMPSLAALDSGFIGGSTRANAAYAMAYRAVIELAQLDPARGLTLFFRYWRESRSFEQALRSAYNVTSSDFEARWQRRTRLRYGALAVAADVTVSAIVFTIMVGPLFIARRRRNRRRLAAMKTAEEEADRAERESAIEALLRSLPPPPSQSPPGERS
jgi:hypothetical protein